MTKPLVRTPIPDISDPIGWAETAGAHLLFQQFDLATRRVRRSVIGLVTEPVIAAEFPTSLRRGLETDGRQGLLVVFAGSEALHGSPAQGPGGFPNHAVMRLVRYVEIDHVHGKTVFVSDGNSRPDANPSPATAKKEEPNLITPPDWRHDADFEGYSNRLRSIRQAAQEGRVSGAVLSLGLQRPTQADPFAIYRQFVAKNPSPFGYVLRLGAHALVGSSPLAFLTMRGRRLHLETDAGTRPVTGDAERDERAATDLAVNPKDASEHATVVDAEREALIAIAQDRVVDAVIDRQVRRFSHVMHLYTALEANLAPGLDLADAILALAPAAAVSGHPKRLASELGIAAEGSPRGPYGGVLGLIDPETCATDLAVVIRSLWLSDGIARLRVGGKIVPHSQEESEYRECLAKSRFLVEGVAAAEREIASSHS